ncbi:beta-L-arabinofuranosidase domain-containing protein [Ruminiclostridium cellobioparum]|uniref:Uncharacterized protein n=1 Tax=Ruminiclostridium cellobioparum subsp. termitidis CT1112 TaxID=1195236 RepID=S0FLG8_RUMCE|nr:beta-L-arabinofuranosidase domain-containing protein [Ruminiclostridium cellobioparum]EMS71161.1 hypothetical protein CTER_3069 [Ruminiclostridium cellobioparum subsp. termitidis CT1112]
MPEYLGAKQMELTPSVFTERFDINKAYLMSLKNEKLLQNYYMQAGIFGRIIETDKNTIPDIHWGWESPCCQLRGHFLGHWLSAAARVYKQTGDEEVRGKAVNIVKQLAVCQQENGGIWAGSIPEQYMEWVVRKKKVWAPQYTVHKTLMGLVDMYRYAGDETSLKIADTWADWFLDWSGNFTREQMDDILDVETGAMLEVWADLYGITKNDKYLELIKRYDRPRLFENLLNGIETVSGKHANTTIVEIHGAARIYEVTGIERYRKIVEAYWKQTVEDLGYFCTGGQTTAEVWTQPGVQSTMLSETNQEHCVVYNMIRLADFLYRWTKEVKYLDYIERNIYNGLFAQQNIETGMVIYYLPLHCGAKKKWGSPTHDFWCCHGTLLQAHTLYTDLSIYKNGEELVFAQYIPSKLVYDKNGTSVEIEQNYLKGKETWKLPDNSNIHISIKTGQSVKLPLTFRIPWWAGDNFSVKVDGHRLKDLEVKNGFITIEQTWHDNIVQLEFIKKIWVCPADDNPNLVAFMYGPVVLAGLTAEARTLYKKGLSTEDLLIGCNKNAWEDVSFYTVNQDVNVKFIPLYNVKDEIYTTYFSIE